MVGLALSFSASMVGGSAWCGGWRSARCDLDVSVVLYGRVALIGEVGDLLGLLKRPAKMDLQWGRQLFDGLNAEVQNTLHGLLLMQQTTFVTTSNPARSSENILYGQHHAALLISIPAARDSRH